MRRFREEQERQREERERFEKTVETGFFNPYSGGRFRTIKLTCDLDNEGYDK